MLENGKSIDLLRLYLCVREKGGYESVTKDGVWDSVANEIGCDSDVSASLQAVYVKYLELLDKWFCKIVKDETSCSNDVGMKVVDSEKLFSDIEMNDYREFLDMAGVKRETDVKDLSSCVGSDEGVDVKDDAAIESGGGTNEENESSRKRKRERYLPLLDWVKRVSKDPCDPAIGSVPSRSKWKNYGTSYVWKQVLSAREALLVKRNIDPMAEQAWQKNLMMHPKMYDNRTEKSSARYSQRLVIKETKPVNTLRKPSLQDSPASSSTCNVSDLEDNEDSFYGYNFRRKRIPLGRNCQAKVPEWKEQTYEPETKWFGTPIWPLEKSEVRSSLIELERIGKGRQDSCGCPFPGSSECVNFHIDEKRNRVKLELGSAFYKWKINQMGESVAECWTPDEERKFEDIIKANPVSLGITFWDDMTTHFKKRSMAVLVRYYFNVYLIRRRAHQNRSDPSNIDSDDELETIGNEASHNDPGSIFRSPKKAHLNVR
ncbi:AT-rich interactive domain-containing protein 1-like isoform X2 [Rutidosis leptorrhynchoides]